MDKNTAFPFMNKEKLQLLAVFYCSLTNFHIKSIYIRLIAD